MAGADSLSVAGHSTYSNATLGDIVQPTNNYVLFAKYNEWMNTKLYECVAKLRPDQIADNKGAFFGSILGTLNHIMVGDLAWLNRFKRQVDGLPGLGELDSLPVPSAVNQVLFEDLDALWGARRKIDRALNELCAAITHAQLNANVSGRIMTGETVVMKLSSLLLHIFNHQTHHRGQVTTLLSQLGVDYGGTDILNVIPNES